MPPTLRRLLAVAAVLVVATAGTTLPAAAASGVPGAAGDDGDLASFGVAPAQADHADDRPYITMTAAAGSVLYENVALINMDDQPIDLDVYPADVVMADGGGLSLTPRDRPNAGAGAWIAVTGPTTVTVPAQTPDGGYGSVVIPFSVTIPADAEPGDHVGGVVAALRTTGRGANTPTIELEQRVAARVYVRVQGPVEPGLEVRDIRATHHRDGVLGAGSATVRYTLANTGNVRLAVDSSVTIAGPFGLAATSADGEPVAELLPGATAELSVEVPGVLPLVRDTVTVHATASAPAAGDDPGLREVTAEATLWVVPWLVLGLLLLLVALVVWRRRVRAVRRRQLAAEAVPSAEPGTPTEPASSAVPTPSR